MTELRVHTYTAAEPGLFANSYLLDTKDGVVPDDVPVYATKQVAAELEAREEAA